MTDTMDKIVERIQKLLALGKNNRSEAEAAAAMAKAQELLTQHNLDMASVEGVAAGSAKREKAAQAGGMYVYQRRLWRAVAQLNFCLHFRRQVWDPAARSRRSGFGVTKNLHMIVGRTVNVRATIAMGEYLEGEIERLCRERLAAFIDGGRVSGYHSRQFSSSWAVAYREGIADRIVIKLQERRDVAVAADERRKRAAQRASDNVSDSQALTLTHYVDAETDANNDFLYGEGWSANKARRRAERAAEEAERDREHAEWAAAHPEEAAAQERKWEAAARRRSGWAPKGRKVDAGGYWAGYDAGEGVGIDPQARDDGAKGQISYGRRA